MLVLRDYQEELVSKTLGAWSGGTRKVLLQLSTGGVIERMAREKLDKNVSNG